MGAPECRLTHSCVLLRTKAGAIPWLRGHGSLSLHGPTSLPHSEDGAPCASGAGSKGQAGDWDRTPQGARHTGSAPSLSATAEKRQQMARVCGFP